MLATALVSPTPGVVYDFNLNGPHWMGQFSGRVYATKGDLIGVVVTKGVARQVRQRSECAVACKLFVEGQTITLTQGVDAFCGKKI